MLELVLGAGLLLIGILCGFSLAQMRDSENSSR